MERRCWWCCGAGGINQPISATIGSFGVLGDGSKLWLCVAQPCTLSCILPSLCLAVGSLASESIPVWGMTLAGYSACTGGGLMNCGGVTFTLSVRVFERNSLRSSPHQGSDKVPRSQGPGGPEAPKFKAHGSCSTIYCTAGGV